MAGKQNALDIAMRREKIEALMLMEFTTGDILELMPDMKRRTLERDMEEIRRKWREEGEGLPAREQLREQMVRKARKAENKAWLIEAKSKSYSEKLGAIKAALQAQKRQARLLGLDAPIRTEVSGPEGGPIEVREGLDEQERAARVAALLAAFGHAPPGSPPGSE